MHGTCLKLQTAGSPEYGNPFFSRVGQLEFGLCTPAVAPVLSALYFAKELAERYIPGA